MKHSKKLLSLLLVLCMVLSLTCTAFAADGAAMKSDDIVVLYTNDVHCQVDPKVDKEVQTNAGYTNVAAYKADMEAAYNHVTLVDCGDAIQGGPIGAMTKGEAIVEVMNAVGYDIATFGNHEFDYGMDQLANLVESANAQYISCNFTYTGEGDAKVSAESYVIKDYGDTKVAFVGISTPESFTKSTPTYFQDENGNYIYSFAEGNNGKDLYDAVQKAVDDAKTAGADYVVAVAHTGTDKDSAPWTSPEVISNTTGIDVYLDGHSHSTIAGEKVANKDGKDVILTSTGTKLENIGKLVIGAEGITTELVNAANYTKTSEAASAAIGAVEKDLNAELGKVVAKSDVDLTTLNPETGKRAVRSAETNLGDLCADAYRVLYNTDIGFVNGGGVRADIEAGDITYGQIIEVHPYSNEACVVKVSGQAILDALELSASAYPSENGGFLQVSGLHYEINSNIPSSVVKTDKGAFVKVEGERRVSNVYLLNDETGAYDVPIDPEAVYTVASHNYMLLNGGDGYTMFKNDPKFEQDTTITPRLDNKVLIDYIVDELGGVVPVNYLSPEGRIYVGTPEEIANQKAMDEAEAPLFGLLSLIGNESCYTEESYAGVNAAIKAYLVAKTVEDVENSIEMLKTAIPELVFVPNTFEDVAADAWYASAVDFVQAAGLMNGMGDAQFAPDVTMTRAMVATALYRDAGAPSVEKMDCPFTDLEAGWYYVDAVIWAYNKGIFIGTTGATFDPNAPITREQMATVLVRMSGVDTKPIEAAEAELVALLQELYTDGAAISRYARASVAVCNAAGLMVGDAAGTFRPQSGLTRAEFAQVMENAYNIGIKEILGTGNDVASAAAALAA